ncbi:RNA-directed DNA polymerase from mobile element jockey [Willisornis vidua]|uniref:RNA-directed DNA polymerase from mobile element jockey n=1 Tax=Willisornis vidua TaxID=1566151 RepID=A0ABQ9DBU9_9PASS|nr:RNA-directed DNA polymerase from mobile element jockey [Willisornis vidua]
MKFNKGECQILHLGLGYPDCVYRLGNARLESSAMEKDLGILVHDPLSVKEELVCELLQELDPYKLMGYDIILPKVLRELTDVIARASHTFLNVLEIREHIRRLEEASVTPIYENGLKEDPGNYITSAPAKVME